MHTPLLPRFEEEYSAKLPALMLLQTLGWAYLSPRQALAARQGKTRQVVLRDSLRAQLQQRRFLYAGWLYPFSTDTIEKAIDTLCAPALNEGLPHANEKLTNHLLYGMAVREFVDGRKLSPTLAVIDWEEPENNQFYITEEFTVQRHHGVETRRPDIVCFVNGLPLAVIEAKRPDGYSQRQATVDEGISQQLRNQRPDEIPALFAYTQLLLSINGVDGRYATLGTAKKFWAPWQEQTLSEAQLHTLKNTPLTAEAKTALLAERPAAAQDWYTQLTQGGALKVSGQDRLLIGVLSPQRLLEMVRFYTLFDQHKGKMVARYPQVQAVKAVLAQIDTPATQQRTARQGGVIWHTTGSGKSLTMVFLCKALILHETLKQCRILLVTDRTDLEKQLSETFKATGELSGKQAKYNAIARTGRQLAEAISHGNQRVMFSMIHKFVSAAKAKDCYNDTRDLVVLVDEGHRSQGGLNYLHMRRVLPNAAFIAYTGTPLLKDSETTHSFGPIVHAYTMRQAEQDGAVTPLLYEERKPTLSVNEQAIDNRFEAMTARLTPRQKGQLKKQYARKGYVYGAQDRIQLIAYDIANHLDDHIDQGLKGQLACDSKLSAVRYKQALDECGLFDSAIVMSAPDSREGNIAVDESAIPEVTQWWRKTVGTQHEKAYTDGVIERFDKDDTLKLVIVVDKLLTGFDEPKNAVLYIDKPLKAHNLIQAIARVNRLHTKKEFGYLIDYRGILAELDTTIAKYQDLADQTQGGFYIADIQGLYRRMQLEYRRLPDLHQALWAIFAGVNNTADIEQLRAVLVPRLVSRNGRSVDSHLEVREAFYAALGDFARCLKVASQSADYYTDSRFTERDRQHYHETLKQLSFLRRCVKADANESVDYDAFDNKFKKLMDQHVVGLGVAQPEGVYEVNKLGQGRLDQDVPTSWPPEKTRNETDIIRTRVTRTIEQQLRDDPYAQAVFSELLLQVIKDAEALFESPLKQYLLFRTFEENVTRRALDDIPAVLSSNKPAQAYFGVFKLHYQHPDDEVITRWIALAEQIDATVKEVVATFSINPEVMEMTIRQQLLAVLFAECQLLGKGLDQAKVIVEQMIDIVREGCRRG